MEIDQPLTFLILTCTELSVGDFIIQYISHSASVANWKNSVQFFRNASIHFLPYHVLLLHFLYLITFRCYRGPTDLSASCTYKIISKRSFRYSEDSTVGSAKRIYIVVTIIGSREINEIIIRKWITDHIIGRRC